MDQQQQQQQQPLLSNGFHVDPPDNVSEKRTCRASLSSVFVSVVKLGLKIAMWVIFLTWIYFIFKYPLTSGDDLIKRWTHDFSSTFLGVAGAVFLVYSGPILAISFLSVIYFLLTKEDEYEQLLQEHMKKKKVSRYPKYKLWTLPMLVEGAFGVVSAAELLWMMLFVVFVVWAAYVDLKHNLIVVGQDTSLETFIEKSALLLSLVGFSFGSIGLFLVGFLFLAITRGSAILRLIDIPFEQAAKYHVWLGHLSMTIFTLHGLCYVVSWSLQGNLLENLLSWEDTGVADLAGVIALGAGAIMWTTSLPTVRRKNFELFYYTHHLYIVFIILLALHIGAIFFSFVAGSIFLYMLDRLLRVFQSRATVDVVSATYFPCETVQLVLAKPKNLMYNALGFIFLQVRESSWLQWHPFSVSSSAEDGDFHLSVLIKVQGEWTKRLKEKIMYNSEGECQNQLPIQDYPMLTASVEGPYGHILPYHLMYEKLILVAGGIGISPFLAILSDIMGRVQHGKLCLPKNILVVWAIQRSDELCLLYTINDALSRQSSFPNDDPNFETLVYVTRESESLPEEGASIANAPITYTIRPIPKGSSISSLVATGNRKWNAAYVISPVFGFLVLLSLMNIFYVNPNGITGWYLGILFLGCMLASVLIFGVVVIGFWYVSERRVPALDDDESEEEVRSNNSGIVDEDHGLSSAAAAAANKDLYEIFLANSTTLHYGSRPNFKEIFESMSERWGSVDVGVIVCGPPTLDSSVARVCRSHNLCRNQHQPIFHFHSHSFDL